MQFLWNLNNKSYFFLYFIFFLLLHLSLFFHSFRSVQTMYVQRIVDIFCKSSAIDWNKPSNRPFDWHTPTQCNERSKINILRSNLYHSIQRVCARRFYGVLVIIVLSLEFLLLLVFHMISISLTAVVIICLIIVLLKEYVPSERKREKNALSRARMKQFFFYP